MSRKSMSSKAKSRKSMTRKSMARKTLSDKSSSGKSSGKSNRFRASKANGTPWVEELKSLEINDDNWKYHLTIIEEQKSEFSGLLDSAAQYAMNDGNRLEVRFISSDFMKEKVLNHCARTNETSAYSALCEAIKQAAGRNFDQEIPVDLIASFIKYEIYEFREYDYMNKDTTIAYMEETEDAWDKLDIQWGGVKRPFSRRSQHSSVRRQSSKGDKRRQSAKRGSRRRQSAKRGSTRRQSAKRGSTRRQSAKRGSTRRQSAKRGSTRRQSAKRGSTRRQSAKRGSTRRQSSKFMRKRSIKNAKLSIIPRPGQLKIVLRDVFSQKFDTKLHIREFPRKDIRYKEDCPIDGPQVYFVIMQNRRCQLPEALRQLNISTDAVVMYSEPRLTLPDMEVTQETKQRYSNFLKDLLKDYLHKKSDKRFLFDYMKEFTLENEKVKRFWDDFYILQRTPEKRKQFEHTIISMFGPYLKAIDIDKPTCKEDTKKFAYEEICLLTYYLSRITQLYNKYNESVRMFDVSAKKLTTDEDLVIYKSILDTIPNEVCEIPIILDTLLIQVCINEDAYAGIDLEKYGWKVGKRDPPMPPPRDYKLHSLENEYDVLDENKPNGNTFVKLPTLIAAGDVLIWKTLHLGKLGKYIRERTLAIQKHFMDTLLWKNVHIDPSLLNVHQLHLKKLENAVGVREKKIIAEWIATMKLVTDMFRPEAREYFNFQAGPILASSKNFDKASNLTLQGDHRCNEQLCHCLEQLEEMDEFHEVTTHMHVMPNISEINLSNFVQTFYHLFNSSDVYTSMYSPLLNSVFCQFYNAHSTYYLQGEFGVPVKLRDFYNEVFTHHKEWCLKTLNDIASESKPKIFTPRMDLLMANLDSIVEPVGVSQDLAVTYRDFIEPHSIEEEEMLKLEEAKDQLSKSKSKSRTNLSTASFKSKKSLKKVINKKDKNALDIQIIEEEKETIDNVYVIGEDQPNNFQEKQLNFVLPGGSRIGLKYDESVFNRTELMVKTFVEGHMLCFHVPLYGEARPIKFILEHENGMILSFSESVSPQRKSSETSINKVEDTATESMSEASTAKESLAKQERFIEEKRLKKYNELRSKFEEEYYAKMGKSKHSSSKTDNCVVKIIQEQLKEYCDESINLQYKKTTHKHSKMKLRFVSVPFNDPIFNSDDEETSQSVVFDLQISWPNGLHVSAVKSPGYIKQQYLIERNDCNLIANEIYRCILFDGTVIKFMNGDKIIIYKPNSSTIIIEKREKMFDDKSDDENQKDKNKIEKKLESVLAKRKPKVKSTLSKKSLRRKLASKTTFLSSDSTIQSSTLSTDKLTEEQLDIIENNTIKTLTSNGQRIVLNYTTITFAGKETLKEDNDLFCNTHKVERSDGTKLLFDDNGLLIVRFPDGTEIRTIAEFEDEEYFVNWNHDELQMWFAERGIDSEHEEEIEGEYKKLDFSDEGFAVVVISSYEIYHPNYAGVVCGCENQNIHKLILPGETTVHASDTGLYHVFIGENPEIHLNVNKEKIIFDKTVNDQLYQRTVFHFSLFKNPLAAGNETKLFYTTKTSDYTDLRVFTNGEAYFRTLPEDHKEQNFMNVKVDMRVFSVHKDLNVWELLANKAVQIFTEIFDQQGKIEKFSEAVLSHIMGFLPVDTVTAYWRMKYPPIETNNRHDVPSTYGDSYLFPFYETTTETNEKLSQVMIFHNIKTINFKRLNSFLKKILRKYFDNIRVESSEKLSCKCNLSCLADDVIGSNDFNLCSNFLGLGDKASKMKKSKQFNSWLNKKLIPQIPRMTTTISNNKKRETNMKFHLSSLYNSYFPYYFQTDEGEMFLIIENILEKMDGLILEIHRGDLLKSLLNMPLNELTDDMLYDIVLCIKPSVVRVSKKEEIYTVLSAARGLHEYFPSMHHALLYRRQLLEDLKVESSRTIKTDLNDQIIKTKKPDTHSVCSSMLDDKYRKFIQTYMKNGTDEGLLNKVLDENEAKNIIESKQPSRERCIWSLEKLNEKALREDPAYSDKLQGYVTEFQGTKQNIATALNDLVDKITKPQTKKR